MFDGNANVLLARVYLKEAEGAEAGCEVLDVWRYIAVVQTFSSILRGSVFAALSEVDYSVVARGYTLEHVVALNKSV